MFSALKIPRYGGVRRPPSQPHRKPAQRLRRGEEGQRNGAQPSPQAAAERSGFRPDEKGDAALPDHTITIQRVNREYEAGLRFNQGIGLYDSVKANEDFFIGKQWEGVQANGLPTPVFNFLKRVVLFSVANVSTDNLKLHAKPLASSGDHPPEAVELLTDILNHQFASIFEFNKMGACIREFCRNAAVDGDGCLYAWWDPDVDTGQAAKGGVRTEVLPNTQVLFGNPNSREVQTQPYILIEKRMLVEEARRLMEGGDPDLIVPDGKESGDPHLDQLGGEKVTVLTRLWRSRETGGIHACQCTRTAMLREEWDLRIRHYPLTWMSWDFVQDCYHGQAMITGLIPNQIFVNKLFAMSMLSLMTLAYPKVIYDRTRVSKWSSRVGAAIGVNGNVEGVAKLMDPASISPQISQFIELAISYTQKFLGASDVALGDTRPDNTSAIIALQRAAATPMELTRQALLQAIEDMGRIFMDFMGAYYGERFVEVPVQSGELRVESGDSSGLQSVSPALATPYEVSQTEAFPPVTTGPMISTLNSSLSSLPRTVVVPFDFSALRGIPCSVELDVGASSYWSEIASMQTLDNLLTQGKISTVEYLKRLPSGQIADREGLVALLERREAMMNNPVGPGPLTGP